MVGAIVLAVAGAAQACVLFHDRFQVVLDPNPDACPEGWYGSYWQDVAETGQYSFIAITNTTSDAHQVTVIFYDSTGNSVATTEETLQGGAQLLVLTESGTGGLAGTGGGEGYLTVTSDRDPSQLLPWSAVIYPDTGAQSGFTGAWTLR